jgi:hypothetical protein
VKYEKRKIMIGKQKCNSAVAGFSLFDNIRNEDSHVTKPEGTSGVRYYTCAKLFYRYRIQTIKNRKY